MDADTLLEEWELSQFKARGLTEGEIAKERQRKCDKENLVMLKEMLKLKAWRTDISVECAQVYVKLAGCHERMHKRQAAVQVLREGLSIVAPTTSTVFHPHFSEQYRKRHRSTIALAAAKLFFKNNDKGEALALCMELIQKFEKGVKDEVVSVSQASEAYYVAGWVHIHADNHTAAYALWRRGHEAIPDNEMLSRQARKRECWDMDFSPRDSNGDTEDLVGQGCYGDGVVVRDDLDSYSVPDGVLEPALALFDPLTQGRYLVFRSKGALLTASECANVVNEVERYHQSQLQGVWGTVRESSVKTTDVAVEVIPRLRGWLRRLLHSRVYPLLHAAYPRLADGSSIYEAGGKTCRMRVHDAFIVRYSAEDESIKLPKHCDTSSMSLTVALNQKGEDYTGGGLCFDAIPGPEGSYVIDAELGQAVCFAGPLRHGGSEITSGTRLILVLFLYVEGFAYGGLLDSYVEQHGHQEAPQDDNTGGTGGEYVVYRQTSDLMAILDRNEDEDGEGNVTEQSSCTNVQ